jgi:hypothetical protein
LAQNCCAYAVRVLIELRVKHALSGGSGMMWGINYNNGKIEDM